MYVPVCAKRLCVCVSQAVSEEEGRRRRGGGRRLTVRPSLSLVCPSSAVPFRHVPVAFAALSPLSATTY